MLAPAFVSAWSTTPSLADPPGSSVLVAAASWLQGTLLGTIATTIAVIAVSSIGFMMLAGRLNLRHGLTVIIGCFIVFGASTIVAGIQASLPRGESAPPPNPAVPPPPIAPPLPGPVPANNDPYAGASVPRR